MKLPPFKGLLIHIIYWALVAIFAVISTAIGMIYTRDLTSLLTKSLVTQPMLQLRPNWTELRSMDYYHQIFCRFRKCKRKVPPPSPLSTKK